MSPVSFHLSALLCFVLASLSGSFSIPLPSVMVSWPVAVKGVPITSSANPLGKELLFPSGSYYNDVSLDHLAS